MDLYNMNQDIDYMLLMFGKAITINDTPATALIGYSNNTEIEEKKIITKSPVKRGDLIIYNGQKYLVNDDTTEMKHNAYYKVLAQRCNYTIDFTINNIVMEYPAIVLGGSFNIVNGKLFPVANGEIFVTVQNDTSSNKIKLQDTFLKLYAKWIVDGIDKTRNGLITFNCKMDGTYLPDNYVVSVVPSSVNIDATATQQLTASVTNNGTAVDGATFTFVSDNTSYATVDSTGLITGIAEGNCNVTVTFIGADNSVNTCVVPCVISSAPVVLTYKFASTPSNTLDEGTTATYTVLVSDDTTPTVSFTFTNDDVSVAEITGTTSSTVTVHALVSGQTVIRAKEQGKTEQACALLINVQVGW